VKAHRLFHTEIVIFIASTIGFKQLYQPKPIEK